MKEQTTKEDLPATGVENNNDKTKRGRGRPRKRGAKIINWTAIKKEWDLNKTISLRALGRDYGVSHQAISQRAESHNWGEKGSLSAEIREETYKRLAAGEISTLSEEDLSRVSEADIIDAAAGKGTLIIQAHRRDLLRLRQNIDKLQGLIETRMKSPLDARDLNFCANVVRNLAQALDKAVNRERQAYNLEGEKTEVPFLILD